MRGFSYKNARFLNCHTPSMEREYLLKLRNELINTDLGDVFFKFAQDYITQEACKNIDSTEIKGMCRLIQQFKDIPSKL